MRIFLYFLPSILIILSYIVVYLTHYRLMKNKGERPAGLLTDKYMNAFIVCLLVVVVNFGVVYFMLGDREKLQNYILPYLDEQGTLKK